MVRLEPGAVLDAVANVVFLGSTLHQTVKARFRGRDVGDKYNFDPIPRTERGGNLRATSAAAAKKFLRARIRRSARGNLRGTSKMVHRGRDTRNELRFNRRVFRRRNTRRRRFRRPRKRRRITRRRRAPRLRRSHLRLFPGGFPRTKTIKLRCIQQVHIVPRPKAWAQIEFHHNNAERPMGEMITGTTKLAHYGDNAGGVVDTRQCYGWTHWLAATHYEHYLVVGSKTTIQFTPNLTDVANSINYIAGFAKGKWFTTAASGKVFTEETGNLLETEVGDFLNNGYVKRYKTVAATGVTGQAMGPRFTVTYSLKKYQRDMRRRFGQLTGSASALDWGANHDAAPLIVPTAHFIIIDLATSDTAATLNAIVTREYTLKLSNHDAAQGTTT